jgi:hypothetical protein
MVNALAPGPQIDLVSGRFRVHPANEAGRGPKLNFGLFPLNLQADALKKAVAN